MAAVSDGQETESAAAEEHSGVVLCAEEAQSSSKLVATLRLMVNDPAFSDIAFMCKDGKRVQACRMLLAGRSEVLKSMLMSGMAESSLSKIELPEISSPVLLSVFEFLYTGNVVDYRPQSWTMTCELIIASRFFLLPDLETVTRKFMHTQTSTIGQDLPTAALLLTEAIGFKALSDDSDVSLQKLVTILSSDWSNSVYVRNLSEDAFYYLLANSKGNYEDDGNLSFKEYLRFRQVILWWVEQFDFGTGATEELVHFLAPDGTEALSLCRNPENFERPVSPPEDAVCLVIDWNRFWAHEESRNSAIRLVAHIDCRWIHPVLLAKVVEPLKVISALEILRSYRFQALRRPMNFEELTCEWEHGKSSSVTLEHRYVIQKVGTGNGLAIIKTAMSRLHLYQWRFILDQDPASLSFVEMGFLYYARGMENFLYCARRMVKPAFDGEERLSAHNSARVLLMHGEKASVNWAGDGQRMDWRVLLPSYSRMKMQALFSFNALDHTCSLSINDHDFGVVWENLPSKVFYPAVSLGISGRGCVRIELVRGFDVPLLSSHVG